MNDGEEKRRLTKELKEIGEQLLRCSVAEQTVRSVGISDGTGVSGGVELATEATTVTRPRSKSRRDHELTEIKLSKHTVAR
jgi:hypothetical protein